MEISLVSDNIVILYRILEFGLQYFMDELISKINENIINTSQIQLSIFMYLEENV